jgi:predicted nucleic acid-binding protein
VSLFVDTSVWSVAWRRDYASSAPEVSELERALKSGDSIYATGLVLQELLQGFSRPKAHKQIIDRFSALPLLVPDRQDHIQAADLRNACRRKGKQVGTIDALLAQLCVRHELVLLTMDRDFQQIATVAPLSVWTP